MVVVAIILSIIFGGFLYRVFFAKDKSQNLCPHVGEVHVMYGGSQAQLFLQLDMPISQLINYDRREVQVTVHTNAINATTIMD